MLMNIKTISLSLIALAVVGGGIYFFSTTSPMQSSQQSNDQSAAREATVILHTTKGDIGMYLFQERMPVTTANFLKLAQEGFYNNTTFHRVIAGFMIQGGDPNGDGTGGPGYTIQDEFVAGLSNVRGTIAMANTGMPNSGGSQFFINVVDNTGLDFDKPPMTSRHPVFGQVVYGMDVVDAIANTPVDANDAPLEAVMIETIEVR